MILIIVTSLELIYQWMRAEMVTDSHSIFVRSRNHHHGFQCNRSTTDHYSAFIKYLKKNGNKMKQCISCFIDFKKAYDSVRREVLYIILIEFGIPMKLVRLIKTCLIETYSRVRVSKNVSDRFPFRNSLKQGDALDRKSVV